MDTVFLIAAILFCVLLLREDEPTPRGWFYFLLCIACIILSVILDDGNWVIGS